MEYIENRVSSDLDFLQDKLPADKEALSKGEAIYLLGFAIGSLKYVQRELNFINATEKAINEKKISDLKKFTEINNSIKQGKTD